MVLAASSPRSSGLTGTSRQPSRVPPSAATTRSTSARAALALLLVRRQEEHGHPVGSAAGRVKPRRAASRAKNRCGICVSMPAPSPVRESPPTAPRCTRFFSIVIPLGDDLVGAPAVHVHDEPHPAARVLEERVVQPFPLHSDSWVVRTGACAAVCVHRRSAVIAQCCQVRQCSWAAGAPENGSRVWSARGAWSSRVRHGALESSPDRNP